jgi:hypothetical protein
MFGLDVVVVCKNISSTDVLLWGSSWSCTEVVCVLLACMYITAFSPCLCYLYLGEVLRLACGGCETGETDREHFSGQEIGVYY